MRKSIYLIISFVFLLSNSKAQKTRIGITAGTTFGSYKVTYQSVSLTSKNNTGFTFGLTSSVAMGRNFSFMPALNFVQKGGIFKEDGMKDRLILNYLEVPLNFVYNMTAQNGKFFLGAGPSFSVGISGKDKWDGGSSKVKFGKGADKDFKAFESAVNFVGGYEFKSGMLIAVNYNTGLSDIQNSGDGLDGKTLNRYVGIRLGYMFGH